MSFGDSVIVSLGTVSTRRVGRSKGMHMFLKIYKKKKQIEYIKRIDQDFQLVVGGP